MQRVSEITLNSSCSSVVVVGWFGSSLDDDAAGWLLKVRRGRMCLAAESKWTHELGEFSELVNRYEFMALILLLLSRRRKAKMAPRLRLPSNETIQHPTSNERK